MISVWKRKKTGMDRDENRKMLLLSESKAAVMVKANKKKIDNKKGTKLYGLLSFHELPDYMKDNEYILDYYRANWPLKEALFSIFRWHNETLNVWTHLLGFLLFVGLTVANLIHVPHVADFISMISEQFPSSAEGNGSKKLSAVVSRAAIIISVEVNEERRWPLYTFLSGSMFCLLSSSTCHLLSCQSEWLNLQLLHLDYVGIAVMIITSFFPPIYYIFQCTPHWQIIYLSGITIMGLCTIVALLSPALSAAKYRALRASLFVSMALFGLIPALHALLLNWHDPHPHRDLILAYESAMALSYLLGTLFYVTRVPERWGPGRFDLAGHSHQIFHFFVLMGAFAHYAAAKLFFNYRTRMGCAAFA
ncbi:heptahelical transmembrane protein1 [Perilla frutescens var. hirtella]|uniref:Heptahelical transmembrane protein1 n=1 Tax=Perilla frutescens var. hirtella TaxID=608512 RepID=A0AAD4J947_PERFH|nr:heptahelical transmembrane protein1 [Perilla frutescens var. hirtella]